MILIKMKMQIIHLCFNNGYFLFAVTEEETFPHQRLAIQSSNIRLI